MYVDNLNLHSCCTNAAFQICKVCVPVENFTLVEIETTYTEITYTNKPSEIANIYPRQQAEIDAWLFKIFHLIATACGHVFIYVVAFVFIYVVAFVLRDVYTQIARHFKYLLYADYNNGFLFTVVYIYM